MSHGQGGGGGGGGGAWYPQSHRDEAREGMEYLSAPGGGALDDRGSPSFTHSFFSHTPSPFPALLNPGSMGFPPPPPISPGLLPASSTASSQASVGYSTLSPDSTSGLATSPSPSSHLSSQSSSHSSHSMW